jgi:hypothetical protein
MVPVEGNAGRLQLEGDLNRNGTRRHCNLAQLNLRLQLIDLFVMYSISLYLICILDSSDYNVMHSTIHVAKKNTKQKQ